LAPTRTNHLRGGRPLEPDRPLESAGPGPGSAGPETGDAGPGGAAPGGGGQRKRTREEPPGLAAQIGAVRDAVVRFLRAHVELARTELDLIKGEAARASGLVAGAIALAILLAFFVPIGGMLFAGEWIFGSIGWGLLHGTLALIAIAVTLILVALYVPGLGRDVIGALLLGLVVALVLGFDLPNRLFAWIGEAAALGIDPAVRPLAVGVALVGIIGLLAGLVIGIRVGEGFKDAVLAAIGGLLAGAAIGAFLSITFGLRVGFALGVTAFWLLMPVLMALRVQRIGIDMEALKARFIPQVTIDTAKESLEWAKTRVPNGPQS